MKIKATPVTAALSGSLLAGILKTKTILVARGQLSHPVAGIVEGFGHVFFLATGLLFIIGLERNKLNIGYALSKEHWQSFPHILLRMLCWFVAAVATGAAIHQYFGNQ